MTTDNRANEPTEVQVEAAAKAHRKHGKGSEYSGIVCRECDEYFEDRAGFDAHRWRAALVAAQGATPSVGIRALAEAEVRKSAAEGNPICEPGVTKDIAFIRGAVFGAAQGAAPQAGAYDHCCNHPKCPGGSLCCCISEQRQRDCWNQWREEVTGDTKQAFRDAYSAGRNDPAPWAAAPVLPSSLESPVQAFADWHERWWRNEPDTIQKANAQAAFFAGWDARGAVSVLPSSGVDEEKLAEVLSQHVLGEPNGGTASWAWLNCSCSHRIEVAGVTREHVVALGRKHQARAVAEWLKGQGR